MRANRKDGVETRERLLDSACRVFAAKGFQDASIAEICEDASANVAAVNYHFGSKDALYVEVWRHTFKTFMQAYPLNGGLPADAPPEDRLFARVHALLQRVFDDGRVGQCFRIGLRELVNPSAALENTKRELIGPHRKRTQALVRELLGPEASDEDVLFCEISIINQCLSVNFFKERRSFLLGREHLSKQAVETLARHITTFSLGGIRAVRESRLAVQIEAKPRSRHHV
ncbi:MAG: CerR family C-terminal domain-containing protein [Gammaproteobacteria bacterium]|nr:CerR family C-terminal domain-containing protein [Gammaproteobacteria bacterium]